MAIWFDDFKLEHVISLRNNNLNKHLGIEFTELGDDYIIARMPVEAVSYTHLRAHET